MHEGVVLLCSYLIDLTYVVLLKTEGQSISGSNAVQRLVETRIVSEGMREGMKHCKSLTALFRSLKGRWGGGSGSKVQRISNRFVKVITGN